MVMINPATWRMIILHKTSRKIAKKLINPPEKPSEDPPVK
jgi:hypothetical protein